MLRQLKLKNFKSWQSASLTFGRITGLFGTNSSGKSGLIQFLLLLKQTKESTDRAQPINFGDTNSYTNLGSFRDAVFRHRVDSTLEWSLRWALDKHLSINDPLGRRQDVLFEGDRIRVGSTISDIGKGKISVGNLTYRFAKTNFALRRSEDAPTEYSLNITMPKDATSVFKLKRIQGRPWKLPEPVKCYGFPDQVRNYYQNAAFLADFELEFEQKLDQIFYLGPLREYPKREYLWAGGRPADVGRRGERAVDALLYARSRGMKIGRGRGRPNLSVEQYVAYWLKELGLIDSFNLEEIADQTGLYRVKVKRSANSTEALITDVGFGVSQILPILVLLYYVPIGSTVIFEQPEIHLHPMVQSGLADVFIDAMNVRNLQIIFESHSEHLLRRLQRRMSEEDLNVNDSKLYFCNMKGGESELTPLDLDLWGHIRNWPEKFFGDEFNELAMMQRAIQKRKARAS